MQPCPTCGGMGLDASGYCTNCRNFRGVPQQPPPPISGVPYSGVPNSGTPRSGVPHSGGPTAYSVSGPSFPAQASAPSFPPSTYGGGYGVPGAAPKKRSSFMVPLLALCGILALLVIGIVVVAVAKSGNEPTPEAIDACVVGTWETTKYEELVAIDGVGDVPFTQRSNGAVVKLGKDGKGLQTFKGTLFTANMPVKGRTVDVELEANATVRFDFGTSKGTMSFSNLQNTGKAVLRAPQADHSEEQDWSGSDDPSKYRCEGDTLTMSTSRYNAELRRTSSTV